MKRVLLTDMNNVAFRNFISMYESGAGQLKTNAGVPTTVIYGALRVLNALFNTLPFDTCVVCWDGGSKYRKEVCPWYKYNRVKPPWADDYYEELNTCREYLGKLGVRQAFTKGIECDDWIGYLANYHYEAGNKVMILSDDKDFYQLLKEGIRIYRPTKMKVVSKLEAEEDMKYPVYLQARIKALTGEAGDNIPGVGGFDEEHVIKKIGFGPAKALKYLTNPNGGYYKLTEMFDNLPESDRFREDVKNNRKLIMQSFKLARIRTKKDMYLDWEQEKIDEMIVNHALPTMVTRTMVKNISTYLEFKSIDIYKILKNLGVAVQ